METKNTITKIFQSLTNEDLCQCILDINNEDGTIKIDSKFREIVAEVRSITNSVNYSTYLMLCQMNIYKEASLRFLKQSEPKITRFEYITDKGREVVEYGEFTYSIQDDGRTLKVFKENKIK